VHHAQAFFSLFLHVQQAGLVTTSTDGRVNFWSMSNLREPVESLLIPGGSVACLAVAPESESLVLGDEQGSLYSVMTTTTATGGNTKKTSTRRKQVRKWETAAESDGATPAPGHYGMVTSVATRMRVAQGTGLVKGFSRGSAGLVLTTGVDWTTQLWAPAYKDTPLMSWTSHSYDSVSAVAWNPQNPGVWASASSNGSIGLWNLAHSLDEALTDGVMVDDGLMQLSWSSDGRRLAVAGAGGRVHLLTVADEVMRPKGDEDAKIVSQLVTRGLISRP
jgi:dynein intermediate chain